VSAYKLESGTYEAPKYEAKDLYVPSVSPVSYGYKAVEYDHYTPEETYDVYKRTYGYAYPAKSDKKVQYAPPKSYEIEPASHNHAHYDDVCDSTYDDACGCGCGTHGYEEPKADDYVEDEYVAEKDDYSLLDRALSYAHGRAYCEPGKSCAAPQVYSRAHLAGPGYASAMPVYGRSFGHGAGLSTMGGHGYGDYSFHGPVYGQGWGHLPY